VAWYLVKPRDNFTLLSRHTYLNVMWRNHATGSRDEVSPSCAVITYIITLITRNGQVDVKKIGEVLEERGVWSLVLQANK
jgi:hypothetical protein